MATAAPDCLTRPRDIRDILARLPDVKQTGDSWTASCPLPEHSTPEGHLSVRDAGDKCLIRCHGNRGHDYEAICRWFSLDSLTYASNQEAGPVETYDYMDAAGKLVYQVLRYEPKTFKQRRPGSNGEWIWSVKGISPLLYRLPQVADAIAGGRTIYICEGEKDCDKLARLGLVATTNSGGAGKWKSGHSDSLTGANVVIIPDRDEAGRQHGVQVAAALQGKAKSVKILQLPDHNGLTVKDASDWLDSGGSLAELAALTAKAPGLHPLSNEFRLTSLCDLLNEPEEDISYLWQDVLICGGLSILAAKPKVGKSTLARNLALRIAQGQGEFLGRAISASGAVVYLALEEKRSQVKRHFARMGATADLPIFVHVGGAPETVLEELRSAITDSGAVLLVVDPLQRLCRIKDLNDYAEVSLALEPLMQIARDTGCHVLLVHHANKGMPREGGDGILGSTAIFGSVDAALIMKRGEAYRTLESIQRYGEDLPRIVLAFDTESGLTDCRGSVQEIEIEECERSILEVLSDQRRLTENDIRGEITGHKGGVINKALRALCDRGDLQREGAGRKGDAYKYCIAENARDARDSRDIYIESQQSRESETWENGTQGSFDNEDLSRGCVSHTQENTRDSWDTHTEIPRIPTISNAPCHNCGSVDWWQNPGGQWTCGRCHPRPRCVNTTGEHD